MPERTRLLLVDDHVSTIEAWREYLEEQDFDVVIADCGPRALQALAEHPVDMCFIDLMMPGMSGLELLETIRMDHDIPVVIMTGFAQAGTALDAIERGAYEFLTKPVAPEAIPVLVANALETRRLVAEVKNQAPDGMGGLVGRSPPMRELYRSIRELAESDATVLLIGETGTGKTLTAREIHTHSRRATRRFVHINCNAISANLFEAELFGHERGAFTGAEARRPGRFEQAEGGTLLLDEVGNLPLDMQGKLLRVLEEREFERVGGTETIKSNVRIIAATNQPITEQVREGTFRADLFYRLCTIPIQLVPLRQRPEDIPQLITRFLADLAQREDRDLPEVTAEALTEAQEHSWPGNIRELANAVEHAVIRSRDGVIRSVLPPADIQVYPINQGGDQEDTVAAFTALPFQEAVAAFKRRYLEVLLERHEGRRGTAAKAAGFDRRTLQRNMERLGMRGANDPETEPPHSLPDAT